MNDFNIWNQFNEKKRAGKKASKQFTENPYFGSSTSNIFGFGMNSSGKKIERDSRRAFSTTQKSEIRHQQNNKCAKCKKKLDQRTIEYDHIKPWADKGRTITQNGAALCPQCHRLKTHSERLKKIDKKRKSKKDSSLGVFGPPLRGPNLFGP